MRARGADEPKYPLEPPTERSDLTRLGRERPLARVGPADDARTPQGRGGDAAAKHGGIASGRKPLARVGRGASSWYEVNDVQFRIEPEVFERFPEFCVGVVVATGLDNSGQSAADGRIRDELRAEWQRVRDSFAGRDLRVDRRSLSGGTPSRGRASTPTRRRVRSKRS